MPPARNRISPKALSEEISRQDLVFARVTKRLPECINHPAIAVKES